MARDAAKIAERPSSGARPACAARPLKTTSMIRPHGDDRMTSGWMRAAAPNGAAEFVGAVGWSGELGYGVRPAEPAEDGEPADPARRTGETADGAP